MILDIGSGKDSEAKLYWPDAEVHRLDSDESLNPDLFGTMQKIPTEDESYERVLASHVLEHLPFVDVLDALKEVCRVLVKGGDFHLMVPSLEWAAREILSETMSFVTIPHLYGTQTNKHQQHRTGFTMLMLRELLPLAGFSVAASQRSIYQVEIGDELYEPEQHYVVGIKYE
jgi:predicted SAM-dependent methyltransferase